MIQVKGLKYEVTSDLRKIPTMAGAKCKTACCEMNGAIDYIIPNGLVMENETAGFCAAATSCIVDKLEGKTGTFLPWSDCSDVTDRAFLHSLFPWHVDFQARTPIL